MKLQKSDRRLLIWAALVFLPLIVALAFLSQEEQESTAPTTYSAQSRGAKAAYLLLQDMGYNVQRWEQPPKELPAESANTVFVLAGPYQFPRPEDKDALQLYLSHGGKILATGAYASWFLPQADTQYEPVPAPDWKDYPPQLLTPITRGGAIQMSPGAYWKDSSTAVLVHYADDNRPIVVSYKVGNGEVIWWAASTPLTNAAIDKSGNLALLLNSLGPAAHVQVFWDEYFHGYESSFSGYFFQKPVLFGFLQCVAVFLALVFTFSRRSGPIHPPPEPSRLSPLEFVHTLGRLYHRAHSVHSALAVPYARFRAIATRQLGLSPDVPAPELARALRTRLRSKDDGLERLLEQIENALRSPELAEKRALELAQELARRTHELKLIPLTTQETIAYADSVAGAHARTK